MPRKRKSDLSRCNSASRARKAARRQESSLQPELRKCEQAQSQAELRAAETLKQSQHRQYQNKYSGPLRHVSKSPSEMDVNMCHYIGCGNTSKDTAMFRYPVDDWKRLNLWLLYSGHLSFTTAEEFHNKYICCKHFHASKLRWASYGVIGLADGAVPYHYLMDGANSDEEQDAFQLKKPVRVYEKKPTYTAKKGNISQRDTESNSEASSNIHLGQVTVTKENQGENDNVSNIDANVMVTDTKNNKVNTRNINRHADIEIKKEIEGEPELNVDEIDINDQELDETAKLDASTLSTELQIKIEPMDEPDIKIENDLQTNNLKVESDIPFASNKSCSEDSICNESNDVEKIHFEEFVIKEEHSMDVEESDVLHKRTNAISEDVLDIKREWAKTDPEVKCDDPGVECSSASIECYSAVVGCSDTLNTEPRAVQLLNDVIDKQSKTTVTPSYYEQWCCDVCSAKYRNKYDLQSHMVARHGAPKYPKRTFKVDPDAPEELFCVVCKTQLHHHDDLQRHMEKHHKNHPAQKKQFQCGVCFEEYKYEFLLIAHEKEHGGTVFKCDLCARVCKTKQGLAKHLNSHTKERVFTCPTCEQTFTERTYLLNHLINHTPDETFPCISCEKTFRSATELKAHTSMHRTYFPCKVCRAKFPEELELSRHMRDHTKFFVCTFCLMQFRDIGELQTHTDTHHDMLKKVQGSSHVCSHCGKRFLYRSVLTTHEKIHSSERPFSCAKCPKRFKTTSASNEHARGHDMLYKCQECGQSFGRASTLGQHRRVHTGEKPYSCHLCQIAFTQRVSMNSHMKKFHADPKPGKMRKPRKLKTKKNKAAKTQ